MTKNTLVKAQEFLLALDIEEKILSKAFLASEIDTVLKQLFENRRNKDREIVNKEISIEKLNSTTLRYLVNDFLTYWNENISIHTELFWKNITQNHIAYERKEPLRYALDKGHFYNSDQGRTARYNWEKLLASRHLNERYSAKEIETISNIIKEDEKSRVRLLQKCIKNKKLNKSDYLRFGDSIAYLTDGLLLKNHQTTTTLLDNHFTKDEIAVLAEIW